MARFAGQLGTDLDTAGLKILADMVVLAEKVALTHKVARLRGEQEE